MKALISTLMLGVACACAQQTPTSADLQPFYPSPYGSWIYGGDCMWAWDSGHDWEGSCRYHGDGNHESGWAEVHWRYFDFAPMSATPCDVMPGHGGKKPADPNHKPWCPMPMGHKVKADLID